MSFRQLEINGGVVQEKPHWKFILPPTADGYAVAQIDDYGLDGIRRRQYPWRPGTKMRLRARFSQARDQLVGTAGFGFWNAPFADPTVRWPALPQAVWFFFASPPTDLPLALEGPGQGWFAATVDASSVFAFAMIPLAPAVFILNQFRKMRQKIMPAIRRHLKIGHKVICNTMADWHHYELSWMAEGCSFFIDGVPVFQTSYSPSGPLGFVCWIDNQYLIATSRGRFSWGILPTPTKQVLEVSDLNITHQK